METTITVSYGIMVNVSWLADGITVHYHGHCFGVLVARCVAAYRGDVVTVSLAPRKVVSQYNSRLVPIDCKSSQEIFISHIEMLVYHIYIFHIYS